jgi:V/A-type H+-transporting ATPase subunit A
MAELTEIGARERIGGAKSVPDDEYVDTYADIEAGMIAEIDKIVAKAGAEVYD